MAQRRVVTLEDDTTGEVLPEGQGETLTLQLDGQEYEIDLSSVNADRLRAILAPWQAVARRVPKGTAPTPAARARARASRKLHAVPEGRQLARTLNRGRVVEDVPLPEVLAPEPVVEPEPQLEPVPELEPDRGDPTPRLRLETEAQASAELSEAEVVETRVARQPQLERPLEPIPEPGADGLIRCGESGCEWPGSRDKRGYRGHQRFGHGIGGASAEQMRALRADAPRAEVAVVSEGAAASHPAQDAETGRYLCDQPGCENWPGAKALKGLKGHQQLVHGIGGKSAAEMWAERRAKAAAAKAEPTAQLEAPAQLEDRERRADEPAAPEPEPPPAQQATPAQLVGRIRQASHPEQTPLVLRGRCTYIDTEGHRCATRTPHVGDRCEAHVNIRVSSAHRQAFTELMTAPPEAAAPWKVDDEQAPAPGPQLRDGDVLSEDRGSTDGLEWEVIVPALEAGAHQLRERWRTGLPNDLRFTYNPEVMGVEGMDLDIVEAALRNPERVEVAPETFDKGYPVLKFHRGDCLTVLGCQTANQPRIIAAYHGSLLANDVHRVNHTGGAGARKESGLPHTPSQLVRRLRQRGVKVAWDENRDLETRTAPVSYRGQDIGQITVAAGTARATCETDWQRTVRRVEAITRRAEAAG